MLAAMSYFVPLLFIVKKAESPAFDIIATKEYSFLEDEHVRIIALQPIFYGTGCLFHHKCQHKIFTKDCFMDSTQKSIHLTIL